MGWNRFILWPLRKYRGSFGEAIFPHTLHCSQTLHQSYPENKKTMLPTLYFKNASWKKGIFGFVSGHIIELIKARSSQRTGQERLLQEHLGTAFFFVAPEALPKSSGSSFNSVFYLLRLFSSSLLKRSWKAPEMLLKKGAIVGTLLKTRHELTEKWRRPDA